MWTIVYKNSDQEYDVVPSSWLISSSCCKYPDRGTATIARMAKDLTSYEEDWLEKTITIERRDIDDYDRAMANVIRLTKGKRTVTDSENELKLPRNKKKKYASSCEGSEDEDENPQEKVVKKKIGLPPPPPPTGPPPTGPPPTGPPRTGPPRTGPPLPPKTIPLSTRNLGSGTNTCRTLFKSPLKEDSKCKIKAKHICFYEAKNVTLPQMAKKMCYLSKSVTVLRKALQAHHEEIKDLLKNKRHVSTSSKVDDQLDEEDQEVNDLLAMFPIKTMVDFTNVNEQISGNEEYEKKMISALQSIGKKTSPARFVTTCLKSVLGDHIIKNLTWKGQKRGGVKKASFSSLPFCKVLIKSVKLIWKGHETEEIEKTVSGWLAQQATKMKSTGFVDASANDAALE